MIYIAFGSNLPVGGRSPAAVVRAAVAALQRHGVALPAVSSLWRTAPVPAADQPDYVNAVARAETALSPADLLALLQSIAYCSTFAKVADWSCARCNGVAGL